MAIPNKLLPKPIWSPVCIIWFLWLPMFSGWFLGSALLIGWMKIECKLRDVLRKTCWFILFSHDPWHSRALAFARFRGSRFQLYGAKMESRANQFVGFLSAFLKNVWKQRAPTNTWFVRALPKECSGLMVFCQNTSTCLPAFLRVPLSMSTWPTLPLHGTQ